MKIADHWFERRTVDEGITLLWEPHVDPLMRCNIWHISGRNHDLLVDTGMGICSLKDEIRDLLGKPVIAVTTHTHLDHVGSLYEFDVRVVHRCEAELASSPPAFSLDTKDWPADFVRGLRDAGYALNSEQMLTAVPYAGFDPRAFHTPATVPTWLVEEGDEIDLGDRCFEVLHLPGHSPGSIGLWEQSTGTLFSGDAVYDGPLLDTLSDANITDYVQTMLRLRALPAKVVHAGHDPSFDCARPRELVDAYLEKRQV